MLYTYCKNFLFKIMPISAENTRMGSSAESQQLLVHTHIHTNTLDRALGYYVWSRNGVRETAAS